MTGLEDRLKRVRGVTDISVELGEEGLEAIRVRIDDTSDEGEVLEEIRRILVAYGLRSRRSSLRSEPIPEIGPEDLGKERMTEQTRLEAADRPVGRRNVAVRPVAGGLRVEVWDERRRVDAQSDATPLGAAEAMVRALARWLELAVPTRVAISRLDLDDAPVLVLLVRDAGEVGVGAAVVGTSLEHALERAAEAALTSMAGARSGPG